MKWEGILNMNGKTGVKLIRFFTTLAFVATIFSIPPDTSLAAEGGWIEGQGYWTASDSKSMTVGVLASSSPESHWAGFQWDERTSYIAERCIAHTRWSGVYHYSRARYEGWFGVEGDSGRVWGMDATDAYSGWVDPAFATACTYWGN